MKFHERHIAFCFELPLMIGSDEIKEGPGRLLYRIYASGGGLGKLQCCRHSFPLNRNRLVINSNFSNIIMNTFCEALSGRSLD